MAITAEGVAQVKKYVSYYIKKWRKILTLDSWDIQVSLVPIPSGMSTWMASTRTDAQERVARMEISSGWADVDSGWDNTYNLEETVIHELIHVCFVASGTESFKGGIMSQLALPSEGLKRLEDGLNDGEELIVGWLAKVLRNIAGEEADE